MNYIDDDDAYRLLMKYSSSSTSKHTLTTDHK